MTGQQKTRQNSSFNVKLTIPPLKNKNTGCIKRTREGLTFSHKIFYKGEKRSRLAGESLRGPTDKKMTTPPQEELNNKII